MYMYMILTGMQKLHTAYTQVVELYFIIDNGSEIGVIIFGNCRPNGERYRSKSYEVWWSCFFQSLNKKETFFKLKSKFP